MGGWTWCPLPGKQDWGAAHRGAGAGRGLGAAGWTRGPGLTDVGAVGWDRAGSAGRGRHRKHWGLVLAWWEDRGLWGETNQTAPPR